MLPTTTTTTTEKKKEFLIVLLNYAFVWVIQITCYTSVHICGESITPITSPAKSAVVGIGNRNQLIDLFEIVMYLKDNALLIIQL